MAKASRRQSAKSGRKSKPAKRAKSAAKARSKCTVASRPARKTKTARKTKVVRKARPKARKGIVARIAKAFHTIEETVQETQALRNKMEPPGTAETQ